MSGVRISVVVPVYNGEEVIGPCIDSLLAQTHAPEIIVVDDGSNDGTSEILSQFSDRIRWID